jgi:putative addiction module killer protein
VIEVRKTEVFEAWFDKLRDRAAKIVIARRIDRSELGNFGDQKSVGDGVLELRIFVGPGYRVYFTRRGNEIVILLCGGDKSSQSADIAKAKQLAAQL